MFNLSKHLKTTKCISTCVYLVPKWISCHTNKVSIGFLTNNPDRYGFPSSNSCISSRTDWQCSKMNSQKNIVTPLLFFVLLLLRSFSKFLLLFGRTGFHLDSFSQNFILDAIILYLPFFFLIIKLLFISSRAKLFWFH